MHLLAIRVLATLALVQDPPTHAPLDDAVTTFVTRLDSLAQWCQKERLLGERDQVYELILQFAADHAAARKALKFSRDRSGAWRQDPGYRAPRAAADAGAFRDQRAAAVAAFKSSLHALIDGAAPPPAEARAAAIKDLLAVDPEDAPAHAALGEVRAPTGAWVLSETLTGKARRAELHAWCGRCLQDAHPLADSTPSDYEQALGVKWQAVCETPAVRVLGTGSRDETMLVARANHAAGDLFRWVFGCKTTAWDHYTLYVLASAADKDAVLERHPSLSPEYRQFLRNLNSGGFPGTAQWGHWGPDQARRLDSSVRGTIASLLGREFHIDANQGWIFEGFGLYLTRELIGTRLTSFAPMTAATGQEEKLRARLMKPGANWMNEALVLLAGGGDDRLAPLIGKAAGAMSTEDVLTAYALAAFLLEGHPGDVASIARRAGGTEPAAAVLASTLHCDLIGLQQRLRRWLGERC
ncbi:MAG: hypothetical protein U1E76_20410 [Planctomycetota bacterium]